MMKKLLTLIVACFACLGIHAQNAKRSLPAHLPELRSDVNVIVPPGNPPIAAKSTAFMQRWYNHTALVDQMYSGLMSYTLMPIWHDSTVLESFPLVGEAYAINFSSMAEVFDPIHFTQWSDTLLFADSLMSVSDTNAYNVDSISFSGSLRRGTGNRPPSVVDTFILSIAVNDFPNYITDCSTELWVGSYISCQPGEDTLRGFTILETDVDSVDRTQLASNGAIVWKIPIVDSMRHDSAVIDQFVYEVPGGLMVPAGKGFAVTVTFKSGDSWPLNVDTFTKYHNFSGRTGECQGPGSAMPYFYYEYNDHGMSNTMFSVDPTRYAPNVFIEGWNTTTYPYEFHDIAAHIGCNGCLTIAARNSASVNDVKVTQISSSAYPVPASEEVNILFSLDERADVTVSITNTLGQVVAMRGLSGVAAYKDNTLKFSTANMSAGIYFYTIEANGRRKTDRFIVSH